VYHDEKKKKKKKKKKNNLRNFDFLKKNPDFFFVFRFRFSVSSIKNTNKRTNMTIKVNNILIY
jgi:hypothetical protein